MASKVSIVRCPRYNQDEVLDAVTKAVDLLGGISSYVKKGETILLKPNILSAKPPESGVDTHPELVRAVARIVKAAGAMVIVGDSPGGFYFKDSSSAYEASGIKRVCEEEDIKLVAFDAAENVNGIPIAKAAREADGIISLPKIKTHNLTIITGAIKNSYGLAVGLFKADCHFKAPRAKEFATYVVNVFETVLPRLVLMDGITAMEGDGPAAGDLRDMKLILGGNDCVACDSVFSSLIGIRPLDVEITAEAYRRGLGEADLSKIEIFGEGVDKAKQENFKLPKTSVLIKIPKPVLKLLVKGIKFRPVIEKSSCRKCGVCVKSCPAGCITMKCGEYPDIDYKKCVTCFCCFELCSHKAIAIKRSFLARLLGGG